jgi:kinesin family protein 4/21/27
MTDKVIPVKVAIRIRPLNQREREDACSECLRTVNGEPQIILGKDKAFTYDYVFSHSSPQIEIYETAVQSLLNALFSGYNATVLAYGQTGSGKTFTMGSGYVSLQSATSTFSSDQAASNTININDLDDVGVIPRVLNDLFLRIDEEQSKDKEAKFAVKVSFVELYNKQITDLFIPMPAKETSSKTLEINKEAGKFRVEGLLEIDVTSAKATLELLEKGSSL